MSSLRFLAIVAASLFVAACGQSPSSYTGPEVTQILVDKSERRLYLLHKDKVLRQFDVGLGFQPVGHKMVEGDGRTPEGVYFIDRRNPDSRFHLSVGISYPNERDLARAIAEGVKPGGDIFIHGTPNKNAASYLARGRDWTWGCIAVENEAIEQIYLMVRDGTPIYIKP